MKITLVIKELNITLKSFGDADLYMPCKEGSRPVKGTVLVTDVPAPHGNSKDEPLSLENTMLMIVPVEEKAQKMAKI